MSDVLNVRLDSGGNTAATGLIRFDGEILEFFQFGSDGSRRFHIATLASIEVKVKSGMLSEPVITVNGRNGDYQLVFQGMKPDDEEAARLQTLVEAVNAAASSYQEASP